MHEQAIVATIRDNVSLLDFQEWSGLHFDFIAGPDVRQHTAALNTDAGRSKAADQVSRKIDLYHSLGHRSGQFPVALALGRGSPDFATGQRHGLKHAFVL